MIRLDDILNLLRTYVSPDELEQIQRAYRLAKQACSNQSDGHARVDMSPALGAARILAELEASVEGVAAALLVNLEEDQCDLTAIDLEVGELVAAVREVAPGTLSERGEQANLVRQATGRAISRVCSDPGRSVTDSHRAGVPVVRAASSATALSDRPAGDRFRCITDLCTPGPPVGCVAGQVGDGGSGLSVRRSRGLPPDCRRSERTAREPRGGHRPSGGAVGKRTGKTGLAGRDHRPTEAHL